MNSASAILAAASTLSSAPASGTTVRPITRRALPEGYAFPDQAPNGTILVNLADGTISGETAGHVAVTISNVRYETKFTADDMISVLQEKSGPNSWQHNDDPILKRKMLTRYFLDNGIKLSWLRPVVSMTPETASAITEDLDALAAL